MIKNYLLSVFIWVWGLLMQFVMFPIAFAIWLLTVLFDKKLVILHQFSCFWASHHIWVNPFWKMEVAGRENIKWGETYVLVSNHQSMLDILLLYNLFRHFKWVSKAENFKIPMAGWNMGLNRYIKLKRGDRKSIVQMVRDSIDALQKGNSILIFPEGTRSRTGELQSFKDGAFVIAHKAQKPVVPMVLDGTAKALHKKGFIFRGNQKLTVKVLEAIPYERFKDMTIKETSDMILGIIAGELEKIRKGH
jgi:1-acyl-sn-glycerol-3-phosphate acyltransferase